MVKMSHGLRAKTRGITTKHPRERGMSPITRSLQTFEVGEKAHIVIDPAVHRGMPHRRFHGRTGTIVGRRGRAYIVSLKVGNVEKKIISRPEHLKAQNM